MNILYDIRTELNLPTLGILFPLYRELLELDSKFLGLFSEVRSDNETYHFTMLSPREYKTKTR